MYFNNNFGIPDANVLRSEVQSRRTDRIETCLKIQKTPCVKQGGIYGLY